MKSLTIVFLILCMSFQNANAQKKIKRIDFKTSLKGSIEKLEPLSNNANLPGSDRAKAAIEAGNLYLQLNRVDSSNKQTHLKKAAEQFEIATKFGTDEGKTKAFNNCGATFLKLKDYEKANECFSKCNLRLIPQEHQYVLNYNRGLVYLKLNQPSKAVAQFSSSFAKNPNFLRAAKDAWKEIFDEENKFACPNTKSV